MKRIDGSNFIFALLGLIAGYLLFDLFEMLF